MTSPTAIEKLNIIPFLAKVKIQIIYFYQKISNTRERKGGRGDEESTGGE